MYQNISIRVPWKDNGYNGLVCNKPCYNTACMRLKNIAENKDDSKEEQLAGCPIKGHETEIPCLSEGGCYMSSDTYSKITVHPYKKNNPKTHGHFRETELIYPPYSLPGRPFGWTMVNRKNSFGKDVPMEKFADKEGIDFDPDSEPDLGWKTNWIQDATNQRSIFKIFYQNVKPNESLVITYAKQVPFVEEAKRVVMGIGYVTNLTEPPEHNHTEEGELRSILWETMVSHSIRENRKNGFLMPYKEMMEYAEKNPDFDIGSIAITVDDEYFDEFSYATEHVSHDAAISILLKIINALRIIKECIPEKGNWTECIKWCKNQLKKEWLDRGPFPGLGAALTAVDFEHGKLIAREIQNKVTDLSDFENETYKLFDSPKVNFSKKFLKELSDTRVSSFKNLSEERKQLFWLLARINLTEEQAQVIFKDNLRKDKQIECTDKEILENPYILYEKTRMCEPVFQISVKKIDMAVFPSEVIDEINPVPEPSCLVSGDDKRRIRALSVSILEEQAVNGHTVYPQFKLVGELNNLPLDPACEVSSDAIDSLKDFLKDELEPIECEDRQNAFQLNRLFKVDTFIRQFIEERMKAERFNIKEDWSSIVDNTFDKFGQADEKEKMARKEKTAILQELADSRMSVLIGGAGTGKTTLLSLLCKSESVKNGDVLLLAPTGKARVRISKTMNDMAVPHAALTIAQFLIRNGRFDWRTMSYRLSNKAAEDVPETVIIDESSMMTEEMFGALLSALQTAKRIIFVGDPNQLPPIGSGRPFVDLVRYLQHDLPPYPEPQVSKGFGELTITRRQADDGSVREDSQLAEWFKETKDNLDENIFSDLQGQKLENHVVLKQWSTPEELQQKIFETICEETDMTSIDDVEQFDISLGGKINSGWMNFGSYPSKLDSWQILSSYKNDASIGSATINRYIHEKYRSAEYVKMPHSQKVPTHHLLGIEGIVYGDKVINVRNQRKDGYLYDAYLAPSEKDSALKDPLNYVANGEVGIVERLWEKEKGKKANTHQIRFNSQPLFNYNWFSNVSEEGNNDIELAYALTVHKAQGSEFDKVILVLSEPSRMISRELLYTALTRQKTKIIILYNDKAYKLKNYSSVEFSDIARRFTCLFEKPNIVEFKNKFYEEKLIHKTKQGEMVRSKSEVIIANMLYDEGKYYEYEKELKLKDGSRRSPDFTIIVGGKTFYWEHLGMLQKDSYRKGWEIKKKQYEENGIIEGKNLIISKDGLDGSLDSQEIERLIKTYLN